jgi:sigma-B regulation protein RsbU (phosphoserine phosphatase)
MAGPAGTNGTTAELSARHDGGAPAVPVAAERTPTAPTSIADFLTDGSLAALCAELSRLTGVPVELRDAHGRLIVPGASGGGWRIVEDGLSATDGASIPLMLGGTRIGALVVREGEPVLGDDAREVLETALGLLARTATELCQHEIELRHRVKEVAALTRMSSLLVRAAGPEKVLDVALSSAMDVLELDAGSIMLLQEDADGVTSENEADLVLKASRNLSRDWLECPTPLSKDRVFDRLAMAGQMVIVEDMRADPRVQIPERAAAEGLGAAIHAGLVFQNRPQGVIRLYSRRPRGFDEMEKRLLASLAEQAAAALEQSRLLKFEQEEQRVQRQLQLAADVQRRMLPRRMPTLPGLDVAARYIPSFELGGDFYDFVELSGHLGIAVGDVVGKGIAAALLMSAVRASLRAHVQEVYDIDEVVSRVNAALCQDMQDNEFASLWYGVIDPGRMRLTYCSAGHEPPLVVRVPKDRAPTPAEVDELSIGGMVVGIDPAQRYQRAVFDLKPRDVVFGFTDGVPDATNFAGERFGKKRLRAAILAALRELPQGSSSQLADKVLWHVRQFTGLSPRADDLTLIVVRVS